MPARGDRFGRYELVAPLGRGGMGEVWQAVLHGPQGFEKPVALKLLRAGPSDEDARRTLIAEARLGAMLAHPNVVGVYELGEADGSWFFAMEWVRGPSASDLLRAGPLSSDALVDLGVQACAGLAHVHALRVGGLPAGLVHRDVKPANLLVDRSGLVKVADLGVARLAGGASEVRGTPGYMAPEQADGQEDARADVFSLGATLFALATGRPLLGRGLEAISAARRVDAIVARPSFSAELDAVVPGLGATLARCLRRSPADRWTDMAALAEALRGLRRAASGASLLDLLPTDTAARLGGDLLGSTPSAASQAPTVRMWVGNLAPSHDRWFGRADEVARVEDALARGDRWVLLLGPGGMGKTRLSLEVGRRRRPSHPGGVWFCDLSAALTAEGICHAVGAALGTKLDGSDPVDQVGAALASRGEALVLLDNLEQVVGPARPVVTRWLAMAPEAQLVGTSRVPLGVQGERPVTIGPLATDAAVALFLDRSPRPPPADERGLVTELVEALDGMPLAIELAAARTRMLPVRQILARLRERFQLIAGGGADRPERHRSLRASLDGSWELASPWERSALAQLSVFASGWRVEAAEAVLVLGPDAPWALDLLDGLAQQGLVQVDGERMRLLVAVAEYAAEKLDPRERAAAEARHGAWLAQLGSDDALGALWGPGGEARFQALAQELDDLAVATRRAIGRGDAAVAVAAARAAWTVLERQGPFDAAIDLLQAVDRAFPGPSVAIKVALGRALHVRGRMDEAALLYREALATRTGGDDRRARAAALGALAIHHHDRGELEAAQASYEEAVELLRQVGPPRAEGSALGNFGTLFAEQGRWDEALALFERARALHRSSRNTTSEAMVLGHMGGVLRMMGRLDEGRACYEQALAGHRSAGNQRQAGVVIANLGNLALQEERHAAASDLYREALAIHRAMGDLRSEGIALSNLAFSLELLGRYPEARDAIDEAIVVTERIGDTRSHGIALARLAAVLEHTADAVTALSTWEAALVELEQVRAQPQLDDARRAVERLRAAGAAGPS